MNELRFSTEEAIFIDDSRANIDGAKSSGWQAIRHDPSLEVMDHLDQYISLFEI